MTCSVMCSARAHPPSHPSCWNIPVKILMLPPFVDSRCKTPIEKIQAAVDGIFSFEQGEKLKIIRRHMNSLENHKAELESLILGLTEKYIPQIELLLTIPGINDAFTAIRILAEIGADMSVFETSQKLCSWAGLTPQNNESAGKKKTTRIVQKKRCHLQRLESSL